MPTVITDLRELDRRAVEVSTDIVRRVRPSDLGRPTPCSEWNLGDLLGHMTAQHRGFAAASRGQGADLTLWKSDPGALDAVGDYQSAASAVLSAFAVEGVPERSFTLPEISTEIAFPGSQAIGFHFIDYVVHGWDVARTLGERYVLDDALAAAAERIAAMVPDGPERLSASAAFRPALRPSPATDPVEGPATTPLDRVLLALGRSPDWPA